MVPSLIIRPIGPSIAYVKLQGEMFSAIEVDDMDRVSPYRWTAQKRRRDAGFYVTAHPKDGNKKKTIYLHRLLLGLSHMDSKTGDHKNCFSLDNRLKGNLRVATRLENNRNRKGSAPSGYKGVHRHRNRWVSRIKVNGKRIRLWSGDDPREGHAAYCEAAKKYHGEFARTE